MKTKILIFALLVSLLIPLGCTRMNRREQGTVTGAAGGAAVGAGISALAGGNWGVGAALGGVLGGVAGNIYGGDQERGGHRHYYGRHR